MIESENGFIIIDSPFMHDRTTIKLGGEAIAEVRVTDEKSFEHLPQMLERLGGRVCVMGEGSNILAAEGKLPIVLVSISCIKELEIVQEYDDALLVQVCGGMRLPALLGQTSVMGLTGLEGLCGIPGSVGGAVAMNAGSFGTTMGAHVESVQIFSPSLGLVQKKVEDFVFSYRRCELVGHSGWFMINSVTFKLQKGISEQIRSRMRDNYLQKQRSQPITSWSAGCVFKNPSPENPAGKLLDEAGFKGKKIGDMAFSSLHANFLVNRGHGTFADAMELIESAKLKVLEDFAVELELEVKIWP